MSRFIFDITDDERAGLEAHRVRLGLRSHAETVRALIRGGDAGLVTAAPDAPRPSFSHGRSKTVVTTTKGERTVAVPTYERKAFNPQPKPGKK